MTATHGDIFLQHVRIVRPMPGDTIVYLAAEELEAEQRAYIMRLLKDRWPDHPRLLLDAGDQLEILRVSRDEERITTAELLETAQRLVEEHGPDALLHCTLELAGETIPIPDGVGSSEEDQ